MAISKSGAAGGEAEEGSGGGGGVWVEVREERRDRVGRMAMVGHCEVGTA